MHNRHAKATFGEYKYYGIKENEPETVGYWLCDVAGSAVCEINFYIESPEGD